MRHIGRFRRNREGQALVEIALVTPILMLMVVGIIEMSQLVRTYLTITDAAREGARTAVLADMSITADSIHRLIGTRIAAAGFDTAAAVTTLTNFRSGCASPNPFCSGVSTTVAIAYTYHMGWLQPIMQWTTGQAGIQLRTASVMRQE